jgi:hypothetical protein
MCEADNKAQRDGIFTDAEYNRNGCRCRLGSERCCRKGWRSDHGDMTFDYFREQRR